MTFIKSSLMIGIILILCFFMEAKGEVNLYLSRVNYLPGDLWRASVEIKDFEYDGPLDVYFLLMNPKGDIYTLPQNTSGINPAFEGLTIPPGYNLSRTVIWERTCPNNVVPIHDFGNYVFAFALTKSGTFDIVGNIAFKKALYEKPKRYGEWWYLYPNNDFNTLAVDKYDRIWCSSEETGLFCIEGDDIRYYEKRNSSLEDHGIRQIIFGINDELWLRYSGYFAKFYPDTDEFSIFELPHEGVDDFKVNYIDVDVDNTVYVATSNGLYIIRPDSPVIEHHAVLNTYTDLSAVKVVGDMIYIARMYGIHEYYKDRINDESLNRYWDNWSASTYATDMELDHENILWIVTNNVVFDLILDEGNLINTIYLAKDIAIDSINRKWFSYGSNIWMIGSDNKYSGHWDLDMWVSGIAVKSNDEIVCSCNGISSFDLEKGQLSNFRDLSNSNKVDPTSGGIWKCNENEIWIGSEYFDKNNKRGREFNILHLNDGTWTLRKLESEKFFKTKDFQIWRQAWDKTDILWLIVDYFRDDFYELWIYDPRDESLLAFRNTPLNTYHYISDIEVDSYNRLWIAADDNILIYDIVNDSWIVYDNNIYSNLNSEVHDIEFDKLNNDIVLIGTENGLVIYNLKENSWFYTVEYGTGIIEILSTKFDIWFETGSDSFWQRYNRSSNIYFDKQYSIRSLLDDADGVVFGRSWSNKIVKYSREENDFIEVYNNQNSVLPNGYITLDYLDNRKMILNSGEFILWR